MRVKNYGIAKEFHDRYDATELLAAFLRSLDRLYNFNDFIFLMNHKSKW